MLVTLLQNLQRRGPIFLTALLSVAGLQRELQNICFNPVNAGRMKIHVKARGTHYPLTNNNITRFLVADDKVDWQVNWAEYKPTVYTFPGILGQPWADPNIDDSNFKPKWNERDGKIDRQSHNRKYDVVDGYPRNPIGRTGVQGRGRLGRWGPNHAADPVVTRWKRNGNSIQTHPDSRKQILQFVAIQRRDSLEWAIPGGMIDPGEKVSITLKREFGEEALNSLELTNKEKEKLNQMLEQFFSQGSEIYRGYVDDPRNTDNAWMETVAVNFHDGDGNSVGQFPLHAGDDAVGVKWCDIDSKLSLYASHLDFLEKVANLHKAHW